MPVGNSQREYLRSIALYLPRNVHQRLGDAAARLETTRTALILAAINNTHAALGTALLEPTPSSPGKDLFAVPQSRKTAEPAVQTTIRVTDEQYAAIAGLVAEHHTNRSRLVVAALDLHLGQS